MNILQRAFRHYRNHGLYSLMGTTYRLFRRKTDPLLVDPLLAAYVDWANPITYKGIKLNVRSPEISDDIKARFPKSEYEIDEYELLSRHLPRDHDVVELGGCIGFMAATADRLIKGENRVITLEANPRLLNIIEETRRINDADFRILDRAYHPSKSEIRFFIHDLVVGGSVTRKTNKSVSVGACSLDTLRKELNLDRFSLVVDIEGSEVSLIQEEIDTIRTCCPFLCIEFHPTMVEGVESAKKLLLESGFDIIEARGETYCFSNTFDG